MRRRSTRGWAATALAAATLTAGLAASAASGDVVESSPSDPVGDAPGAAPDLANIAVLHQAGQLLFTVSVANQPTLADQSVVELRLDTDMNPATGSQSGTERLIHRLWTGATRLCTWTGAGFSCSSSPQVTSTYVNGLLVVNATTAVLGIAGSGFDYSVAGYKAPDVDFAPDAGTWRHLLDPPVGLSSPRPGPLGLPAASQRTRR